MRFFLLFIFAILLSGSTKADMTIPDLINYLNNDSLQINDRGQRVQDYVRAIHMNPEEKERRLHEILPIILQYNEPEYYWNWHIAYNATLQEYGRAIEATDHAYEMLKVAEKENNNIWRSDAYVGLYKIHIDLKMLDKSKMFLKKAVECAYLANDAFTIGKNTYLMGYTYYTEGQNDSAIYYLKQARLYNEALGNQKTGEYPYLLARTYMRDGQIDKSIQILDSLANARLDIGVRYYNDYYYAGSLMYLSHAYAMKGNIKKSDSLFSECLKSYIGFDTSLYNYAHLYNSLTYTRTGYHDRAIKSLRYLTDSSDFPLPLEYVGQAYSAKGDFKNAILFYELAIQQKDSTQSAELDQMAKLLEQSSEAELEIQKQIDQEKQDAAQQQADYQEKQKNLVLIGVGIIGVLIFFFGRMLYKRYKIIKKQKEEIHKQKMQVEEKNEEIFDSINYAKRIQNAILPPDKIFKQYLPDSFILYKPKDVVAGDFYWLDHLDDYVIFAVADCTGHGVPGAMVSVICHNALNRSVREFGLVAPDQILNKTRELVIETFEKSEDEVKDGMDIALCTLNTKTNELHFSGANNPLYLIRNGELQEFKGDKQPIGVYDVPVPFAEQMIKLEKGDQIYVFTDGFVDQFGGDKGKKLKPKYFRELLIKYQNEKTGKVNLLLDTAFERWKGDIEQVDDVCIVGVRF